MDAREREIMNLTGSDERWENWMQFTQGRMLPKLSPTGFAVVPTPKRVQSRLKAKLDDALQNLDSYPDEAAYLGSYRDWNPKIVDVGKTLDDLQAELKFQAVNFAGGVKLTQSATYGMRVDRRGGTYVMHYEHVSTFSHLFWFRLSGCVNLIHLSMCRCKRTSFRPLSTLVTRVKTGQFTSKTTMACCTQSLWNPARYDPIGR
jgi:hypothetical protein